MTKIDALRRFLLPCFTPSVPATSSSTTTKKRLSTSLRDDIDDPPRKTHEARADDVDEGRGSTTSDEGATTASVAPPRPSKTMVTGTIFGRRRGHVWFCVQSDRLKTRPALLLELPIPTHLFVKEIRCGFLRVALECEARPGFDLDSCPLRSIPVWTVFCNGKKLGFAVRRKPTEATRLMLKTMQSITVGAGVIPSGFGTGSDAGDGELMYMRANYECVVGGPDSESFHLINPDVCSGQELSIFLLRSK
ncbi:Protein MIZU-KUSSEI like [Actinidia chinensis var. chinensis]|uniref:Protein MIZU-KUSSEI like n=1 Tax=Actinidia chinensis var. chinensis TaxID=1590841 RepID=A0A2R6RX47_ACTCC|nr:Protein MIZU-KUSSEI like [Actinidia chinensis var. chinensis]